MIVVSELVKVRDSAYRHRLSLSVTLYAVRHDVNTGIHTGFRMKMKTSSGTPLAKNKFPSFVYGNTTRRL